MKRNYVLNSVVSIADNVTMVPTMVQRQVSITLVDPTVGNQRHIVSGNTYNDS